MKTRQLSMREVHDLMVEAGFSPHLWRCVTALSVIWAESGGNAWAVNIVDNPDSPAHLSLDLGLVQWNSYHNPMPTPLAFDPLYSLQRMWTVTKDWTVSKNLWIAYNNGAYMKYLGYARKEFGL